MEKEIVAVIKTLKIVNLKMKLKGVGEPTSESYAEGYGDCLTDILNIIDDITSSK